MRKAAIISSLTVETQKETLPNNLASSRLTPKRSTAKMMIQIHVGEPGIISLMIIELATTCAEIVAAPPTQLTHPIVKPIAGPQNSVE